MFTYLKRLVTTGAAYQAGDLLSKGIAVATLPLYTRYLTPSDYGQAEVLLTAVILASIVLRLGVGEAFIRFYYDDDDQARRDRIAGGAVILVAATTTVASIVALVLARPLSHVILSRADAPLFDVAVLGLWAFTNLEISYALLRADERAGTYMRASIVNVLTSVALTILFVVVDRGGARGLLAGNYIGSTVVLLGLWWNERHRLVAAVRRTVPVPLRRMLAFGLPTVPADAGVYALQVIDREYLYHAQGSAVAGLYAGAAKLATVVFVAVRGFQYAWPPLAYSITDDAEAARLYSLVTTYYCLATGVVVAGVALLGRWVVRLLLQHSYYGAHAALPWLALGWALYGLYLVFIVIAGRAKITMRNLPAALVGLVVNVAGLALLIPPLGVAGAGIALCLAYGAMLVVMYFLTRHLFAVGFEWGRLLRLVVVLAGSSVLGELLLPTHGVSGFGTRLLVWLALLPLLAASGFFREAELARAVAFLRQLRPGARMNR